MKGFALNSEGDILIEKHEIQMVHGTDLAMQTVKTVLSTNKGEWTFNEDEGINFANILGKRQAEPKTTESEAYVRKIEKLTAQLRQTEESTKERQDLNKLLERRLDGED